MLAELERAGLVENARRRGEQLRGAITAIGSPLVTRIEGRGLLLGVVLARPVAKEVAARALERGLIVNAAADDRIRLAPPLVIGDDEIAAFAPIFAAALATALDPDPGPDHEGPTA